MLDLTNKIRTKAEELGFDRLAVARADVPLDWEFAKYQAFVGEGMYGGMGYLAENREVRRSLSCEGILAGAKSVVCLAQRYAVHREPSEGLLPHIARYAHGRDYHAHFRRRLRKLADFIRELVPDALARPMCDTAPVLERAWAARSGLGFIGKNGMLIVPGLGSYLVLGEVVTTLDLEPGEPQPSRCGQCTRCLERCPTGALVQPYVLDARKCISYLTIEHRQEHSAQQSKDVGKWLFGCDECQEVCPFNATAKAYAPPGSPFEPLPQWKLLRVEELLHLDSETWQSHLTGSSMRRVNLDNWKRNTLSVLGNLPPEQSLEAVSKAADDPSLPEWLRQKALRIKQRLLEQKER